MSSQLRVNTITSTTGVGTVTLGSGGVSFSGTPTFNDVTLSSINGNAISGNRNRIINGDMRIDQRNNGSVVTAATGYQYPVDRWRSFDNLLTGGWSVQRVADAPVGFTSSFKLTVTTAQSSFTAGELGVLCEQPIEGNNVSDLSFGTASAKTITISFWVKSSITGTFAFTVFNNNGASIDRTYPTTYAISSANTWEYKTITIAGDTTGTWQTGTGVGMYVAFEGYGASDQFGTANTWNAGAKFLAPGIVNLFATNGATWQVTGVQLEAGTVATPFERRFIGQELALCQRYYYKIIDTSTGGGAPVGTGWNYATTAASSWVPFPVTMRTETISLDTTGTASNYSVLHGSSSTLCSSVPVLDDRNEYGARLNFTVASGLTIGQGSMGRLAGTNVFLGFNAEL
jgi:hypothetical protein